MAKYTDIQSLMPGDSIVIECARCNAKLSRVVTLVPDETPCPQASNVPRFPAGVAQRTPPEPEPGLDESLGLGFSQPDLRGMTLDENQMGCCGPDGREPNMRCKCGRTIARLYGDCYQVHWVFFPAASIHIVRIPQA